MFKTGSVQTRRTLLREPLPHGRQVSEVWTGDSHPASDDHRDGLPGVPVEAGSSKAASPHTHWGAPTSHEVGAEDLTDLHKKMSQPTAASNLTFNPLLVAPIESSSSRVHRQEARGHVQHRDLLRIVKPEWYSRSHRRTPSIGPLTDFFHVTSTQTTTYHCVKYPSESPKQAQITAWASCRRVHSTSHAYMFLYGARAADARVSVDPASLGSSVSMPITHRS